MHYLIVTVKQLFKVHEFVCDYSIHSDYHIQEYSIFVISRTMCMVSLVVYILAIIALIIPPTLKPNIIVDAVNLATYPNLSKKDLAQIDREVTQFYTDDYSTLDLKNVTFDESLYASIRSIRHSVVLNHYDYRYTNDKVMQNSRGKLVDDDLCMEQLKVLVEFAKLRQKLTTSVLPLTVVNFLDSYGRTESGALDGNMNWMGLYASCQRAFIPVEAIDKLPSIGNVTANISEYGKNSYIKGRYCMTHMKGTKWPEYDKYFEDRISVKVAVCLPQSCHSYLYFQSDEMRKHVDYLTRYSLMEPYNGERYKVDYLFCLPDEDSPYRQWDLGSKLFFIFVAAWLVLIVYANKKYSLQIKQPPSKDKLTISSRDSSKFKGATEYPTRRNRRSTARKRYKSDFRAKSVNQQTESYNKGINIAEAFSIDLNLNHLLKVREETNNNLARKIGEEKLQSVSDTRWPKASEFLRVKFGKNFKPLCLNDNHESNSSNNSIIQGNRRINMNILDGVRVFATCWIVCGHTILFCFNHSTDLRFSDERMFDLTLLAGLNTLHVISLFYIITGLLITYTLFKQQKRNQLFRPTFWILVFVSRYIRLLPTYFIVFWFTRHVAPYLGSGVYWTDYRTDEEYLRGQCANESWWTMLTMSNADFKMPHGCLLQSWYLSCDLRTMLVLPVYIIILAVNIKAGYIAMLSTIVYSWYRVILMLQNSKHDFTVLIEWKTHVYSVLTDRSHDVYTDLMVRISSYLMGMIAGHLIYLYETRTIKRWPHLFKKFGIKFALLTATSFFFGPRIIAQPMINQFLPKSADSDTIAILIPLFKGAIEICLCIMLVLLITGHGFSIINQLLASNFLKILSKVSYGVFLIHIEVMFKTYAIKFESSYSVLFVYQVFFITVSYIIAFFMHFLYEMPINNLVRQALHKSK